MLFVDFLSLVYPVFTVAVVFPLIGLNTSRIALFTPFAIRVKPWEFGGQQARIPSKTRVGIGAGFKSPISTYPVPRSPFPVNREVL